MVMSLVLGGIAQAGTVVLVVADEVFVGGVDGYQRVSGATQANVGDSVMAGEFGVGQIMYAPGCVITVRPGTVKKVEATPPASCQVAPEQAASPEAPPDWSTNAEAASNADPASEGFTTGQILLGAGIAGGIGVGIFALSGGGGGSDSPASP